MCFGSPKAPPPATPPAPAPPPPDAVADPQDVQQVRREEDKMLFGPSGLPNLRVDRSVAGGGVAAGGTGIRM